jgi:hypothetical protein
MKRSILALLTLLLVAAALPVLAVERTVLMENFTNGY